METNKSEFKATGVFYGVSPVYSTTCEIQISHSGDSARYRVITKYTCRPDEITCGRWQEIKFTRRKGLAYITMRGKKLYLHNFMRIQ